MAKDGEVKLELTAETAAFVQSIKAASEQFKSAFGVMEKAAAEAGSKLDKAFGSLKLRSLGEIKGEAAHVRAAFDTIAASAGRTSAEGQRAFQAMQARLKELDQEAKGAGKSLASMGDGSGLAGLSRNILATAAAFVSIRTAIQSVQSVVEAGMGLEKLEGQLKFATGSLEGANEAMEFLRKTARTLGLDFNATATSFGKFAAAAKGTRLEGEQTRSVFTSVAKASSVMKLSAAETEGVFYALGQMISKGKVQAEELRGQLGERLPGAFNIAARAMGVTTAQLDEMLKKGEVIAEDFLPKFAVEMEKTFGKDAQNSANTLQGVWNNLRQSWLEFLQTIAKSGVIEFATKQIKEWVSELERMRESGELAQIARNIADAIVFFGKAIAGTIEFVIKWGKELAIAAASLAGFLILGKIQAALSAFAAGLPIVTAVVLAMRTAMTGLIVTLGAAATAFGVLQAAVLILPAAIYVGYTALGGFVERLLIAAGVLNKTTEELDAEEKALRTAVQTHQQFNAVIQRLDTAKLGAAADAVRKLKQAALENPGSKDELLEKAQEFANKVSGLQKRLDAERQTLADLEKQRQDILSGAVVQTETQKVEKQIEQTKRLLQERQRSIDEAIRLEQQYAQAAIQWSERAANARSSTIDKVRELQRKGMSEEAQQADIAAQAQQKLAAAAQAAEQARLAASQGNAKASEKAAQETERLAQQADNLASRLQNTGAAISIVQQAGQLIEQSANAAAEANAKAAQATQASIEKQKADLASLNQQLSDLEKKKLLIEVDVKVDAARKSVATIEKEIAESFASLQQFAKSKGIDLNINANDEAAKIKLAALQKPTESTHSVFPEINAARAAIAALERPTSSTHTVYVRQVEQRASGGLLGSFRRASGMIRGAGTGTSDSIPLMGSNGEFMVRAAAVKKWGLDFMNAINSGVMPYMPMPRFANGGAVGAMLAGAGADSGGGGETMTVRLEIGDRAFPVRSDRDTAMGLASALRALSRGG